MTVTQREEILQLIDVSIGVVLDHARDYDEFGCDDEAQELMTVAANLQRVGAIVAADGKDDGL